MKTLALAALLLLVPASAATDGYVTVTLHVGLLSPLVPGKDCQVTVPAGSNGGAVLDQAQDDGCISSWSATTYPFGRFVDCIDDLCGHSEAIFEGTFWAMALNGPCTPYGIDGYSAIADGDTLAFDYSEYYAACTL
jgi:hypothetical protein